MPRSRFDSPPPRQVSLLPHTSHDRDRAETPPRQHHLQDKATCGNSSPAAQCSHLLDLAKLREKSPQFIRNNIHSPLGRQFLSVPPSNTPSENGPMLQSGRPSATSLPRPPSTVICPIARSPSMSVLSSETVPVLTAFNASETVRSSRLPVNSHICPSSHSNR